VRSNRQIYEYLEIKDLKDSAKKVFVVTDDRAARVTSIGDW
jgi:hypothetical protein